MATSKFGPQDLPPKDGYAPIQTERIKLRTILGARSIGLIFAATTTIGFYLYGLNVKRIRKNEVEMRGAQFALIPLLYAERDRAVMKQLRRNLLIEADLMKDVEGWKVGTYYGEPIYKSVDPEEYVEPLFGEHFEHASPGEVQLREMRRLLL